MAPSPDNKATGPAPIAVLVDHSRDPATSAELIGLQPDDRYHTTDNRSALTDRALRAHNVLVIAGHWPDDYTRRELDAVVRFVRRGGG
ncbi:hypothetical protein LCGC14_2507190, partial [marine sediment metagenome]